MVAQEISPTTQRTFRLPNFEFKLADLPAWKVWFGIKSAPEGGSLHLDLRADRLQTVRMALEVCKEKVGIDRDSAALGSIMRMITAKRNIFLLALAACRLLSATKVQHVPSFPSAPAGGIGGGLDAEASTIRPETRFNVPRGATFGYHRGRFWEAFWECRLV